MRAVMADVCAQVTAFYMDEVVPRLRTNISAEVGDEVEAYLGEVLRARLARIAEWSLWSIEAVPDHRRKIGR